MIGPRREVVAVLLNAALLLLSTAAAAQQITSGPYLQDATETSIVVRWRTSVATNSHVRFAAAISQLGSCGVATCIDDLASVTDHEVQISGLAPDTAYFYAVGSTTTLLAGGTANHFFVTTPVAGSVVPTRIWAIGDSGTAAFLQLDPALGEIRDAQGVRDSYLRYAGLASALVSTGASWSYLDDGSDQGTAWRAPSFDDSSWSAGPAELGYGDGIGGQVTTVNCGPSAPPPAAAATTSSRPTSVATSKWRMPRPSRPCACTNAPS